MALVAAVRRISSSIYLRILLALILAYLASFIALKWSGAQNRIAAVNGLSIIFMALPVWGLALLARGYARFGYRLYFVWALAWVVDFLIVTFIMWRYGLPAESPVVVTAISNTNLRESSEYLREAGPLLLPVLLLVPLVAYILMRLVRTLGQHLETVQASRWITVPAGALLILLPVAAHTNHVVARADPVTRWAKFYGETRQQAEDRVRLLSERKEAAKRVGEWQPRLTGPDRRTVVFVIGESSNRSNWSLFGYERNTTPRLDAIRNQLILFPDTVSSFGSTQAEITRLMTSASHAVGGKWRGEPDILMLAKAAGYKIFWLSNSNDFFLNTVFGTQADDYKLVNGGLGMRSDTSLDEKLLPELERAVADPAPLKFIVIPTIGSHQHYGLRYPPAFAKFDGVNDAVSKSMRQKWSALETARNLYDNSILYTDFFVSGVIDRLRRAGDDANMLYVADHAQEVGHLTAAWGHNFKLESGLTVPMFLWTTNPALMAKRATLEARPYQTDELDWTLLSLLGVRTNRDQPQFDLLGEGYRPWQRVIDGRPYIPGQSHVKLPGDS